MNPVFWKLLPVVLSITMITNATSQTAHQVEPGLTIPNAKTPWALDIFNKQHQLVPIHYSTVAINKHNGANIAGSLAGSFFYKPKLTTELDGINSRNHLHTDRPVFFVLLEEDTDNGGDAKNANKFTFVVSHAVQLKDNRVVDRLEYTQLTGNAKRNNEVVETTTTQLPDGWVRIEPKAPMKPGEYVLLPVPSIKGTYATVVYDFGLDPQSENAKDAIPAATP